LPSLLASLAEDGEQNCCQNRDYSDYDQQLNQRKSDTLHLRSLLFLPRCASAVFNCRAPLWHKKKAM
jgi:hypothetical protein